MLRKTISKAGAAAFCSTTQDAFSGETESFCDVEGFFFLFSCKLKLQTALILGQD